MSARREKRQDKTTGAERWIWIVDISFLHPNGETERYRKVPSVQTKRGAELFEQKLRNELMNGTYRGKDVRAAAPTLSDFKDRFVKEWCKANKHKPSGIESKESAFRNYLVPLFGERPIDSFTPADEDRLKGHMTAYAASTYNNAASVLNSALTAAARWKLIEKVPHAFQLLKRQKPRPKFYDFDQYAWLLEAAEKLDSRTHLLALLGGDAGLRRGEMIALEWTDVDLHRGLLTVERSEWKGSVTQTKGMEYRVVPLTKRLFAALAAHRSLRGERILYTDDQKTVTAKVLQKWMAKAQKRAQLKGTGALHILRHTFCSHLAMKGATALSIQKLAGHKDLTTTLGYMHLASGETERAIRLLDGPSPGNLMATEPSPIRNVS